MFPLLHYFMKTIRINYLKLNLYLLDKNIYIGLHFRFYSNTLILYHTISHVYWKQLFLNTTLQYRYGKNSNLMSLNVKLSDHSYFQNFLDYQNKCRYSIKINIQSLVKYSVWTGMTSSENDIVNNVTADFQLFENGPVLLAYSK